MASYHTYLNAAYQEEFKRHPLVGLDLTRFAPDTQNSILNPIIQAMAQKYTQGWGFRTFRKPLTNVIIINYLTVLIKELIAQASSSIIPRKPNGDFENLLAAIYIYLAKKKSPLAESLEHIEVSVVKGRDGSLLRVPLQYLIKNSADTIAIRQDKYDIYMLHGYASSTDPSDYSGKILAILNAYISGGSTYTLFNTRTIRTQVMTILSKANPSGEELNIVTLLNEIVTLYRREGGFTPNGDFEHALAAIYQFLLPRDEKSIIGTLEVTLGDQGKKTLAAHFSPSIAILPPSDLPSARSSVSPA